ncbi:type V toxin-antitoxin system endoribonuclease antitoxin GhoS [Citrobacter braakii]
MGHKIKSCSYKNTAARNARALQKSQEGPIFLRIILIFMLAPALCFAYLFTTSGSVVCWQFSRSQQGKHMAKFTVRVELRNSEDADYEELHKSMKQKGFQRTITTDSGNTYYLPSAEYSYVSANKSKEDVGNLAESVAEKIRSNPIVMVTKSAGRYYINHDKV